MKILIPTVYARLGGSTRVLLAAATALAAEHDVVVRGPFAEADEKTEIVFPHQSFDSLLARWHVMPLLVRLIGAEILSLRGRAFDMIYVHDNPSLYVYGVVARVIRARVIRHVHLEGSSLLESVRKNLAHHMIHISKHCASSGEHVIIRNPISPISISRQPLPGELVVAGSISRRKNQLFAVDVLTALLRRGFAGRLRLCGDIVDADYARQIQRRIDEIGASERVAFDGFIQPHDYLTTTTCLLMPSYAENQPLALLEAVAAEVPVVASDISAHRELVDLGCLAPEALAPIIPNAFAEAVVSAQKGRDTARYAARVREIFSTEKFSTDLPAFFRAIERRYITH